MAVFGYASSLAERLAWGLRRLDAPGHVGWPGGLEGPGLVSGPGLPNR